MSTETRSRKQYGISLVELIMFIVIVSISLTGILAVMNAVTAHSADPMVHKQALAAAESLLEEIELQDFTSTEGATVPVTQANRAGTYHVVRDYNTFHTNGIYPMTDPVNPIAGLENYVADVTVTDAALGAIAPPNAVLITVSVAGPQDAILISGYRTAYDANP